MSIVILQVPEVKDSHLDRSMRCPYCSGETFQRWVGVTKSVRDPRLSVVRLYRYRCCRCRRTFRSYPQGVYRASQTQRLRVLAAIAWTLGLSYRGLVALFAAFRVDLSRMSAWRDV
jgi:DNA-directed RNA polymerase subunit RPC12/RpoP